MRVLKFEQVEFNTHAVSKIAGWVTNSVDPDEKLRSAVDESTLFAQACLSEWIR